MATVVCKGGIAFENRTNSQSSTIRPPLRPSTNVSLLSRTRYLQADLFLGDQLLLDLATLHARSISFLVSRCVGQDGIFFFP